MFYNSDEELKNIIENAGTCIIAEKDTERIEKLQKNPIVIRPNTDKDSSGKIIRGISIGQIHELIDLCATKSTSPRYFVIEKAETMNSNAQNAALKLFEEPKENYHFILQTSEPETLLATIRSRAFIYAPLTLNSLEMAQEAEKEVLETAKRLLVADTAAIIDIAEELAKKKDSEKAPRRDYVLSVIKTTIELAEKSYFKTEKENFTKKINGLILAYKAISENGNIRLQLVANLV